MQQDASSPPTTPSWSVPLGGLTAVGIILVVLLQVLVTLPLGAAGLRVAASDLLVLPFVAAALWTMWRQGMTPTLVLDHGRTWLIALFAVLTMGLAVAWWETGDVSRWALLSRWVGFGLLVAYLSAGVVLRTLMDARGRDLILKALLGGSAVVAFLTAVEYGASGRPRAEGLFANPNAFGCAMVALLFFYLGAVRDTPLLSRRLDLLAMASLVTAVVLSGSRSSFLGLAGGLALLLATERRLLKPLVLAGVIGGLLSMAAIEAPAILNQLLGTDMSLQAHPYIARSGQFNELGYNLRVEMVWQALDYWGESPTLGIGLGNFAPRFKAYSGYLMQIHSSGLWLLTEMGVVGLGVFAAFFLIVLRALLKASHGPTEERPGLQWGAAAVIIAMMAASIGTELLYQRHLWWIMGFALAIPRRGSPAQGRLQAS